MNRYVWSGQGELSPVSVDHTHTAIPWLGGVKSTMNENIEFNPNTRSELSE